MENIKKNKKTQKLIKQEYIITGPLVSIFFFK